MAWRFILYASFFKLHLYPLRLRALSLTCVSSLSFHMLAAAMQLEQFCVYPSYFKLHVRWLRSLTRITYYSKLIGMNQGHPCP
ncbi:hypothetical protein CEQ13_23350 [Klebsiella oxytoca]|nr:hypothetical protein CEQ13_23350 [Klebsiella oxytoca]